MSPNVKRMKTVSVTVSGLLFIVVIIMAFATVVKAFSFSGSATTTSPIKPYYSLRCRYQIISSSSPTSNINNCFHHQKRRISSTNPMRMMKFNIDNNILDDQTRKEDSDTDVTDAAATATTSNPFSLLSLSTYQGKNNNSLDWVNYGISWIYLMHFASFYTQLPGLFSPMGLNPISQNYDYRFWILDFIPNKELGLEIICVLGILISILQISQGKLFRRGILIGPATYAILWILFHELIISGGRFTSYQMDLLLLDAAPITILASLEWPMHQHQQQQEEEEEVIKQQGKPNEQQSSKQSSSMLLFPQTAIFGYRWLLARLYFGAGAVKLLSCDTSWRDLTAIQWHFQSQPLPNPIGSHAYVLHLPQPIIQLTTLTVLVLEMMAPFLFLNPSKSIRQIIFILHVGLMVGIALFGNFGPLQILLIVIGLSLLADLPDGPGTGLMEAEAGQRQHVLASSAVAKTTTALHTSSGEVSDEEDTTTSDGYIQESVAEVVSLSASVISFALALVAAFWVFGDVGAATCADSLPVTSLVYDLLVLGFVSAVLPLFLSTTSSTGWREAVVSLMLLSGSAVPFAGGLGVPLPLSKLLMSFHLGAVPYGLFAVMTGTDGKRPVALIEGASNVDGPWSYIPLLYQVNDPKAPLPFIFPHFPRLDWTLWFVPLGDNGKYWLERLLNGILVGDPDILSMLNKHQFDSNFPDGAPHFVRVVSTKYTLDPSGNGWVIEETNNPTILQTLSLGDNPLQPGHNAILQSSHWPSFPVTRSLATIGRPEYFIWECLVIAETMRQIAEVATKTSKWQNSTETTSL